QGLKLTEYADPDRLVPTNADPICLGLQARRSENLYFYFYLYWLREPESNSAPLGVVIDIWINHTKQEELAAKLDQHCEDTPFASELWEYCRDGDTLDFSLAIKESELPRVGDKLDTLFGYTIRFLKSVKGIASYFRA